MTSAAIAQSAIAQSDIAREEREKLRALRERYAAEAIESFSLAVQSWEAMPLELRTLITVASGMLGDDQTSPVAIASRDWREYSASERQALRVTVQTMREELNKLGDKLGR